MNGINRRKLHYNLLLLIDAAGFYPSYVICLTRNGIVFDKSQLKPYLHVRSIQESVLATYMFLGPVVRACWLYICFWAQLQRDVIRVKIASSRYITSESLQRSPPLFGLLILGLGFN